MAKFCEDYSSEIFHDPLFYVVIHKRQEINETTLQFAKQY